MLRGLPRPQHEPSCCRALESSSYVSLSRSLIVSVCGHILWPQSSQGIKDHITYQTHSLTQLCKPLMLWCVAITAGLLKGQMPSDHSRALLPHASARVDERWTKWNGEGQKKDHLEANRVERQGQTCTVSTWLKAVYWSSNESLRFRVWKPEIACNGCNSTST